MFVTVPDTEGVLKAEVHCVGGEVTTIEVPKRKDGRASLRQ